MVTTIWLWDTILRVVVGVVSTVTSYQAVPTGRGTLIIVPTSEFIIIMEIFSRE